MLFLLSKHINSYINSSLYMEWINVMAVWIGLLSPKTAKEKGTVPQWDSIWALYKPSFGGCAIYLDISFDLEDMNWPWSSNLWGQLILTRAKYHSWSCVVSSLSNASNSKKTSPVAQPKADVILLHQSVCGSDDMWICKTCQSPCMAPSLKLT